MENSCCFLYVLFLSLLFTTASVAQSRGIGTVRGTVADSATGKVVYNATVSLLSARDSSLVTFTITDGEGTFTFRHVPEGHYRILVTHLSYQNVSRAVSVSKSLPAVDTGVLTTSGQAIKLGEVVVKQERAPVTIKNDTLEFNAGSFKTRPHAQVEEMLKKMPGVEISRDGTIKAQGQEVKKVLVDGKPFFGDDPKMATRNLPAEIIDKVQVFDQQSDQSSFSGFDDGNREKTINLVTRRDKRKGVFGQNSAGVGTNGRYQGRLSLNRFNNGQQLSLLGMANNLNQQGFTMQDMFSFGGGPQGNQGNNGNGGNSSGFGGGNAMMGNSSGRGSGNGSNPAAGSANNITETGAGGLNYRDAWGTKVEVSSSYFLNHSNVVTSQKTYRQTILPDTSYLTNQDNQSRNRSTNHRFNLRLDYRIDSLTTLRWTPGISQQYSHYTSLIDSRAFTNHNLPLNRSATENTSDGDGLYGTNHLLLMRKFKRRGRTFSLNLATALNQLNSWALNRSSNFFYVEQGSQPTSRPFNRQNNQQTNTLTNTATASYTEPLSLRKSLELHYAFGVDQSRSDWSVNDFNESTGQYDQLNTLLSNQFNNSFTTHRTGFGLQTRRLKYSYTLGADVQMASLRTHNISRDSSLTRHYTNLLPNALLIYNFARSRTLRITYRTRINAPAGSQLQPVPDYSNPLNIRLGNPDLKPEYIHNLTAMFNSFYPTTFRSLFAVLSVTRTENKIINASRFSQVGAQTTRPINRSGVYAANGFLALGYPVKVKALKANLNLMTNVTYNRGISLVNNQSNVSNSFLIGQGISLNSNSSTKLDFSVGGNINYQRAAYSLQSQQNSEFVNKTINLDLYYQLPFHFVLTSDLTYNNNTGRSAGYNQNFALWNVGLARQLFKNQQGELKVQVYDLLNQNRSVTRNVGDTYIEDVQSRVLNRYFMISFTYHLRRFGGKVPGHSHPGLPGERSLRGPN